MLALLTLDYAPKEMFQWNYHDIKITKDFDIEFIKSLHLEQSLSMHKHNYSLNGLWSGLCWLETSLVQLVWHGFLHKIPIFQYSKRQILVKKHVNAVTMIRLSMRNKLSNATWAFTQGKNHTNAASATCHYQREVNL